MPGKEELTHEQQVTHPSLSGTHDNHDPRSPSGTYMIHAFLRFSTLRAFAICARNTKMCFLIIFLDRIGRVLMGVAGYTGDERRW